MRVLLDTCVLFPAVTRSLLLAMAQHGHFEPLWSDRVLDEWQHAAQRKGADVVATARIDIALLRTKWPQACVEHIARDDLTGVLPDPDDDHVLASALNGDAETLITANLSDFPTRVLARYGLIRRDPDGFLLDFAQHADLDLAASIEQVFDSAKTMSIPPHSPVGMLRKARLPRLAKWAKVRFKDSV